MKATCLNIGFEARLKFPAFQELLLRFHCLFSVRNSKMVTKVITMKHFRIEGCLALYFCLNGCVRDFFLLSKTIHKLWALIRKDSMNLPFFGSHWPLSGDFVISIDQSLERYSEYFQKNGKSLNGWIKPILAKSKNSNYRYSSTLLRLPKILKICLVSLKYTLSISNSPNLLACGNKKMAKSRNLNVRLICRVFHTN